MGENWVCVNASSAEISKMGVSKDRKERGSSEVGFRAQVWD